MTTTSKRRKTSLNRQHSSELSSKVNNIDSYDLSTDHNFIAPNERFSNCVGLYSVLMNRHIIDAPFSKLYQQSLQIGWENLFIQERQKLKPNDVSVLKCFVLNRLLYEYYKDSDLFDQQTKILYDEIKSRMIREFAQWTPQDLFHEVRRWQNMQCRRRLFYFHHQETTPLPGLLMLHKAATNWCHCLIKYCQQNKTFWETEGRSRFIEHFQHSFIIVAQPTGSDGLAVIQYMKNGFSHTAKLHSRIICLLDPDILTNYIELSKIDVILYPLYREANNKKEEQPSIKWEIRQVMSTEGVPVSINYAEINTLELGNFDSVYKRLSFNSTLCQLEFRIKIKIKDPEFEETIILKSQPFGICSHGQYFPKFLAQIFLYEMKQDDEAINPDIIIDFIRRYYIRMTGVELLDHTSLYIRQVFTQPINDMKSTMITNNSDNIYEEILAKIISQIHFLILHPVLSLMYNDSLFLGICNGIEVDKMLNGTREQPHLLLRFNTLMRHQWNANVIVHFIVHDGHLRRASFDMKTFANELCRFICESTGDTTKKALVLSTTSSRNFTDFQWYFHHELHRLNKMASPSSDAYDPLLPILWMTMRGNDDNDDEQMNVISNNMIQKRKRHRSNSFPQIESVSSVSPLTTMNIVVNIDGKDDASLESKSSSPDSNCLGLLKSNSSNSLAAVDEACQSSNHENTTKNRHFLIEVPGTIEISPAVLFRQLAEKFASLSNDKNEDTSSNYLIRPKQSKLSLSNIICVNDSRQMKTLSVDSISDSHLSCDQISKTESSPLTDVIHDDAPNQLKIKEEPDDIDYVVLHNRATYK
ncbi:unnamed protein product [Rotaria sordida]|uniref:Uncharacterized protein n=1 Tax=Rotaria sordida TaxID=392033 RepID=A0A814X7P7_9BILA|nr:unnamed protein product [Rotaria sordida]